MTAVGGEAQGLLPAVASACLQSLEQRECQLSVRGCWGQIRPPLPVQGHGLLRSAPMWSAGASGPWIRNRDRDSLARGCWRDGLGARCSAQWGSPGWVEGQGVRCRMPGLKRWCHLGTDGDRRDSRARRWLSCVGTRSGQGDVHSLPTLTGRLLIRVQCEGGRSHTDPPFPELCLPSTSFTHPVLPGGNGGEGPAGTERLGCFGGWEDRARRLREEGLPGGRWFPAGLGATTEL